MSSIEQTTETASGQDTSQADVIEFLGRASTYGVTVGHVQRLETHGALVFLAGDEVYKIKRAVRFPYMDFSTLEQRRRACEREIEIDRPLAPEIYLGLVAITRDAEGRLALAGAGATVEWAVHMRRFPSDAVLSQVAASRGIDSDLARDIADVVFEHHRVAPVSRAVASVDQMRAIIDEIAAGLSVIAMSPEGSAVQDFAAGARLRLEATQSVLRRRAECGHVRRCHGDLHLNNIVLWRGRPTLFDALEFDEGLATIDTLYDLAFLLMDIDRHGHRAAANRVLNRYLWRSQRMIDIEGLAALPLFMALRAGIRAMVAAQRAVQCTSQPTAASRAEVAAYLLLATRYLAPPSPRLIAVGGVSGTGKSTLASALAPRIGAAPGAVHLRSDAERKAMFGKAESERLPAERYAEAVNMRVYDGMLAKARSALLAGHAVVVDAAHLKAEEKARVARLAHEVSVPFEGIWLTASADILRQRVRDRLGDASDATVDVLDRQLGWHPDSGEWTVIEAGGSADEVLAQLLAHLDMAH